MCIRDRDPITAAYTASVDYKNTTIALSGEYSFEVIGTKAGLLAKFDDAIKDITVADVVRTGEDITVTFAEDVAVSCLLYTSNRERISLGNLRWTKRLRLLRSGSSNYSIIHGECGLQEHNHCLGWRCQL